MKPPATRLDDLPDNVILHKEVDPETRATRYRLEWEVSDEMYLWVTPGMMFRKVAQVLMDRMIEEAKRQDGIRHVSKTDHH